MPVRYRRRNQHDAPSCIARRAGLAYRAGSLTYPQMGDGSCISVYVHDLELQIGPERFVARVGFSERLGVAFNLLGRESILARFTICFQELQGILTFAA